MTGMILLGGADPVGFWPCCALLCFSLVACFVSRLMAPFAIAYTRSFVLVRSMYVVLDLKISG